MKLIEKKCPNCGAHLSFDIHDTEAHCNYCGQEFVIEKNITDASNEMLAKNYKLHKKIIKTIGLAHIIVTAIILITIIGFFIFIFSNAFKQMSGTPSITIEQIDDDTLDMIHDNSLDILNNWMDINILYTKDEYENVGYYLYKDDFYTKIADVFKTTYTNKKNEEKKEVYVAVVYKNVTYKDEKVSLDYNGNITMNMITIGDSPFESVPGYRSLEELYNKAILSEAKGKIYASKEIEQ